MSLPTVATNAPMAFLGSWVDQLEIAELVA
jgi:hypothetical protein